MPQNAGKNIDLARQTELAVEGMTCSNCALHVTEALQGIPGVASAGVLLERGQATVRWKPDSAPNSEQLIEAVQKAGYSAHEVAVGSETKGSTWSPFAGWKFNVVVGLATFCALVIGEWVFKWGME